MAIYIPEDLGEFLVVHEDNGNGAIREYQRSGSASGVATEDLEFIYGNDDVDKDVFDLSIRITTTNGTSSGFVSTYFRPSTRLMVGDEGIALKGVYNSSDVLVDSFTHYALTTVYNYDFGTDPDVYTAPIRITLPTLDPAEPIKLYVELVSNEETDVMTDFYWTIELNGSVIYTSETKTGTWVAKNTVSGADPSTPFWYNYEEDITDEFYNNLPSINRNSNFITNSCFAYRLQDAYSTFPAVDGVTELETTGGLHVLQGEFNTTGEGWIFMYLSPSELDGRRVEINWGVTDSQTNTDNIANLSVLDGAVDSITDFSATGNAGDLDHGGAYNQISLVDLDGDGSGNPINETVMTQVLILSGFTNQVSTLQIWFRDQESSVQIDLEVYSVDIYESDGTTLYKSLPFTEKGWTQRGTDGNSSYGYSTNFEYVKASNQVKTTYEYTKSSDQPHSTTYEYSKASDQ